ncbi:MAG: ABC transporter permease, partial [Dysgonamonadaceae bacterium]|nr:ABC transporter permease [Dysgonamonadaceae bacterium]
ITKISYPPIQSIIKINPEDEKEIKILRIIADNNFLSFFKIEGSETVKKDYSKESIIINRTLAQLINSESLINSFYENGRLVNVNYITNSIPYIPDNQPAYLHISNMSANTLYLRCLNGRVTSVKKQITEIIHDYAPGMPIEFQSLHQIINNNSGNINIIRDFFLTIGVLCFIITLFGIYVAIITDTSQRKKEVALRKVNGAHVKDILFLFVKLYLKLISTAFLIAFPFMLMGLKLIFSMLYSDVSVWNLVIWISTITIVTCFVFATVFYHIWKVANVNPTLGIKSE